MSLINNCWLLKRKIGSGSFGEVYAGVNAKDRHAPLVAIKIEPAKKRNPHLVFEARLMQQLKGGVGVPNVYFYGTERGHNIMVIDLLGPSLEELFDGCGRHFSLKTALQLIEMMLCRIEFVHSRFIIHRDIKPHNFLMGRDKLDRLVHIIDFGLAKRYRDPKTLDHIPYREGKSLTGTARYVSINTHVGIEQSRRDDLESLAYVFIYFVKGQLPWQSLRAEGKKQKYTKIKEMKVAKNVQSLCQGLPKEFADYLTYCRSLRFTERPDYGYCRSLFRDLFFREQFTNDFLFDWSAGAVQERDAAKRRHARLKQIYDRRKNPSAEAPQNEVITSKMVDDNLDYQGQYYPRNSGSGTFDESDALARYGPPRPTVQIGYLTPKQIAERATTAKPAFNPIRKNEQLYDDYDYS